jgi:hypothetical protein
VIKLMASYMARRPQAEGRRHAERADCGGYSHHSRSRSPIDGIENGRASADTGS